MSKKGQVTYNEIYQQPASFKGVNDTLRDIYEVLDKVFAEENHYDELIFTGCGTSLYIAQTAAYVFSSYTGISAKAVPCSELYFSPETYVKNKKVLVLPITRKSYTTEVRMAIDKVRSYPNVKSLAITCDPDSLKYNDYFILSPVSAEDSVIMTVPTPAWCTLLLSCPCICRQKDEIEAMADYDKIAEKCFLKWTSLQRK